MHRFKLDVKCDCGGVEISSTTVWLVTVGPSTSSVPWRFDAVSRRNAMVPGSRISDGLFLLHSAQSTVDYLLMLNVWCMVTGMYVGLVWEWRWLYRVLVKDVVMLCSIAMHAAISVDSRATSHAAATTMRVLDVTGWCLAHVAGSTSTTPLNFLFHCILYKHIWC